MILRQAQVDCPSSNDLVKIHDIDGPSVCSWIAWVTWTAWPSSSRYLPSSCNFPDVLSIAKGWNVPGKRSALLPNLRTLDWHNDQDLALSVLRLLLSKETQHLRITYCPRETRDLVRQVNLVSLAVFLTCDLIANPTTLRSLAISCPVILDREPGSLLGLEITPEIEEICRFVLNCQPKLTALNIEFGSQTPQLFNVDFLSLTGDTGWRIWPWSCATPWTTIFSPSRSSSPYASSSFFRTTPVNDIFSISKTSYYNLVQSVWLFSHLTSAIDSSRIVIHIVTSWYDQLINASLDNIPHSFHSYPSFYLLISSPA